MNICKRLTSHTAKELESGHTLDAVLSALETAGLLDNYCTLFATRLEVHVLEPLVLLLAETISVAKSKFTATLTFGRMLGVTGSVASDVSCDKLITSGMLGCCSTEEFRSYE